MARVNNILTQNVKDFFHVLHSCLCLNEGSHSFIGTFDGLWNTVDILWFDDGLQVILENLREVVWKFV